MSSIHLASHMVPCSWTLRLRELTGLLLALTGLCGDAARLVTPAAPGVSAGMEPDGCWQLFETDSSQPSLVQRACRPVGPASLPLLRLSALRRLSGLLPGRGGSATQSETLITWERESGLLRWQHNAVVFAEAAELED